MSKKLSDYKDKDKNRIISDVQENASVIGIGAWYNDGPHDVVKVDGFGLCQSCTNFGLIRSQYKIKFVYCEAHSDVRLNEGDPVTDCSNYTRRGELNLQAMFNMATIIESTNKTKCGF